jgi:hypothetical protein
MTNHLRRRVFFSVTGACVVTLAACVVSDFADGQYACNPDGDSACPPGLLCARDGVCRSHDVEAGAVTPSPEAASDAPTANDGGDAGDATNPCDNAMWITLVDGRAPLAVTLTDDGRLYTGGQANGTQSWVAEVDTCDGGLIKETLFDVQGAVKPNVGGLVAAGNDLAFCGGAEAPNGVYGLVDRTPAATTGKAIGGQGFSGFGRSVVASDGAVWHSGAQHYFESIQTGWVVRTVAGAETCQLTGGSSVALAPGPTTGSMYVMRNGATSSQVGIVDSACVAGAAVGSPLAIGTNALGVATLIAAPGALYALGSVNSAPASSFAFLAALDLATGTWTTATLDPNPSEPDILQVAAFDTHALYLGVNERAGFGTGRPTFYRYDPPFTASSAFAVLGLPFGAVQIALRDMAVAPLGKDGVYVVASSLSGSGGIARCRKSGECAAK